MFWYHEEIKRVEEQLKHTSHHKGLLFYGSSSIRMWNSIDDDFAPWQPINLGFGGSTLAACSWFFPNIMQSLQATGLVLYAGDNDLGDNRHPEEIFIFFKQIILQIEEKFGPIPIGFISIKPSINRWHLIEQIKFTNKIIQEEIKSSMPNVTFINIYDKMFDTNGYPDKRLFLEDCLHLSQEGYAIWKEAVINQFLIPQKIPFTTNPIR